jgi:hypothetical protein
MEPKLFCLHKAEGANHQVKQSATFVFARHPINVIHDQLSAMLTSLDHILPRVRESAELKDIFIPDRFIDVQNFLSELFRLEGTYNSRGSVHPFVAGQQVLIGLEAEDLYIVPPKEHFPRSRSVRNDKYCRGTKNGDESGYLANADQPVPARVLIRSTVFAQNGSEATVSPHAMHRSSEIDSFTITSSAAIAVIGVTMDLKSNYSGYDSTKIKVFYEQHRKRSRPLYKSLAKTVQDQIVLIRDRL